MREPPPGSGALSPIRSGIARKHPGDRTFRQWRSCRPVPDTRRYGPYPVPTCWRPVSVAHCWGFMKMLRGCEKTRSRPACYRRRPLGSGRCVAPPIRHYQVLSCDVMADSAGSNIRRSTGVPNVAVHDIVMGCPGRALAGLHHRFHSRHRSTRRSSAEPCRCRSAPFCRRPLVTAADVTYSQRGPYVMGIAASMPWAAP